MSNSEQFCLRWNNHQSTLVSVFENLLDTNVLIDCTLCAEGKFLKAHRVVLSACSPIFKDMMAIQEDKHPIVFLNDVSFLEMRAMLDYMYKGEVNIVQDQLDSFLRTAAALQIKGLTDQGGGGSDEPPAKKGPGRKTGMSDAPESPLVGNAPLREGSMSPTRRRRRVPRRPDSADDQSAENSCDIPSAPQTGSLAPAPSNQSALSSANQSSLSAADLLHHGPVSSTPTSASRLPPVRKHEPIDQTQVVKQEYVEEPQEDIEDLTLDDDEDYNDNMSTVSDMAKPGTSFHHSQSNQGDFGVDWNPIMANQSGTDDVFLRATEAINNQSTTQDPGRSVKHKKRKKEKSKTPEKESKKFKIPKILSPHKPDVITKSSPTRFDSRRENPSLLKVGENIPEKVLQAKQFDALQTRTEPNPNSKGSGLTEEKVQVETIRCPFCRSENFLSKESLKQHILQGCATEDLTHHQAKEVKSTLSGDQFSRPNAVSVNKVNKEAMKGSLPTCVASKTKEKDVVKDSMSSRESSAPVQALSKAVQEPKDSVFIPAKDALKESLVKEPSKLPSVHPIEESIPKQKISPAPNTHVNLVCPFCSKSFAKKELLKKHTKYECGIGKRNALGTKDIKHFDEKGNKQIDASDSRSSEIPPIREPHASTTGADSEPNLDNFACSFCSKTFNKSELVKRHMRYECLLEKKGNDEASKEVTKKAEEQSVDDQTEASPSFSELNEAQEEIFACSFCPSTFKRKELLKRHARYECGLDKQPSNPLQDTKLLENMPKKPSISSLDRIPRKPVTKKVTVVIEGNFSCSVCNQVFNKRELLKRHKKYYCSAASKPEPVQTDAGPSSSTSVTSSEPEIFACSYCPKTFKKKGMLRAHKRYECELKPKRSKDAIEANDDGSLPGAIPPITSAVLPASMAPSSANIYQSEPEVFTCTQCMKSFDKKEILNRHTRYECRSEPMATDETSCTHCPFKASDKQALKTHISVKHYVPW